MSETISVVVPTYNAACSLPMAIDSIRSQNWPHLEIVVVDDGSSDETHAALERLPATDLRVVRQANEGPAAARNRGINGSTGDWVAFLDADDIWLPGKLEAQMSLLRADSSLSFCYTDSLQRAPDGTERLRKPGHHLGDIFLNLLLGPQFGLPTVIVKRGCFSEIGFFDPELRTGEDWDFWLRLAAFYRGGYVPTALALTNLSEDPGKYPLDMFERCQMHVLNNLFSNNRISQTWPQLRKCRRRLFSWHHAVLAKSYLHRGRIWDFSRLAAASIRSHPIGLYFLARSWSSTELKPNVLGLTQRQ